MKNVAIRQLRKLVNKLCKVNKELTIKCEEYREQIKRDNKKIAKDMQIIWDLEDQVEAYKAEIAGVDENFNVLANDFEELKRELIAANKKLAAVNEMYFNKCDEVNELKHDLASILEQK